MADQSKDVEFSSAPSTTTVTTSTTTVDDIKNFSLAEASYKLDVKNLRKLKVHELELNKKVMSVESKFQDKFGISTEQFKKLGEEERIEKYKGAEESIEVIKMLKQEAIKAAGEFYKEFTEESEKFLSTVIVKINRQLSEKDHDVETLSKRVGNFLGAEFLSEDDNHPLKELFKNSYDQLVNKYQDELAITVSITGDEQELWISYEDNAGGFSKEFIQKAQKDEQQVAVDFEQGKNVSYEKFLSNKEDKSDGEQKIVGIQSDKSGQGMTGGKGLGLAERYHVAKTAGGDLLIRNKRNINGSVNGVITMRVPRVATAPTRVAGGKRQLGSSRGFGAAMEEPVLPTFSSKSSSGHGLGLKISLPETSTSTPIPVRVAGGRRQVSSGMGFSDVVGKLVLPTPTSQSSARSRLVLEIDLLATPASASTTVSTLVSALVPSVGRRRMGLGIEIPGTQSPIVPGVLSESRDTFLSATAPGTSVSTVASTTSSTVEKDDVLALPESSTERGYT